jgi:peptide-methionine (S)-S-oxide reductase
MIRRIVLSGLALLAISALVAQAQQPKPAQPVAAETKVATFAGGCFWCMEAPFDKLEGVVSTISGFMGGKEPNPTYNQVASGQTGHTEVVQVTYDPKKVAYEKLVDVFWRNHDPLDAAGQFCDRGQQYRPAVFFHDDAQKKAALASKTKIDASGQLKKTIVTEITAADAFTAAEVYHQDYYIKNPIRYAYYRNGCGRDARLEQLWGKATH